MSDDTLLIIIESPSGERFEADVPSDTTVGKLARDFFDVSGWTQNHYRQRAIVELVNPDEPDEAKRLDGNLTIGDYQIKNGDVLRIFPESIAGGGNLSSDILSILETFNSKSISGGRDLPLDLSIVSILEGIRAELEVQTKYIQLMESKISILESKITALDTKLSNIPTNNKPRIVFRKSCE